MAKIRQLVQKVTRMGISIADCEMRKLWKGGLRIEVETRPRSFVDRERLYLLALPSGCVADSGTGTTPCAIKCDTEANVGSGFLASAGSRSGLKPWLSSFTLLNLRSTRVTFRNGKCYITAIKLKKRYV